MNSEWFHLLQEVSKAVYNEPEELEIPRDGAETPKNDIKPEQVQNSDHTPTSQSSEIVPGTGGQSVPETGVPPRALRSLSDTDRKDPEKERRQLGRSLVKRTLSESFALDYDNQTLSDVSSSSMDGSKSFSKDPLANVRDITQLQAIQSGTTLKQTDSVVNVEKFQDYLEKMENMSDEEKEMSKFELSLNLEDAREVLKRSEGVEELDSPESIQRIDQEDCFSWEEDRLLLTIEHKDSISENEASKQHNNNNNHNHQSDSKKESCDTQDSGIESASPSVNVEGDVEKNPAKSDSGSPDSVDKGIPSGDVKKSPGNKAAILKNRISSAISGLKAKKGGQDLSPTAENSPQEMAIVLRSSKLTQDECGFPLAVFTKVRFTSYSEICLIKHVGGWGGGRVLELDYSVLKT